MKQNEFDNEIKYRLFRTVREILHPSISKKNISDYKIIIEEEILPVRIFYPKKVTGISKVIIYIRGNGNVTDCLEHYSQICKDMAEKTERLLIAIDYEEIKHGMFKMYQSVFNTVKYLYKKLLFNGILEDNICLMGDSTGCNIITGIDYLNNNEIPIKKEILFYPVLSLECFNKEKNKDISPKHKIDGEVTEKIKKYFTYVSYKKDRNDKILTPLEWDNFDRVPNILIVIGSADSLLADAKDFTNKLSKDKSELYELPFSEHGFLKSVDKELEDELFSKISTFLK